MSKRHDCTFDWFLLKTCKKCLIFHFIYTFAMVFICLHFFYSYKEFESLIHKWRLRSGEYQEDFMWKIADSDLIAHKHKVKVK